MRYKSLHTCIRVTNLEKSIEFYEKALGMEVTSKKDFPEDEFTLVYMTSDHNYEIELTYNYGKTDYTHGDFYGHMAFEVENLKKSHEYHKSLGYEVDELGGLEGVATFYFMKDPDGFNIEIIGK